MPTPTEARLQALASELKRAGITYRELTPMADTGLAHDHVWIHRLEGDDWVARLPKQPRSRRSRLAWPPLLCRSCSSTALPC